MATVDISITIREASANDPTILKILAALEGPADVNTAPAELWEETTAATPKEAPARAEKPAPEPTPEPEEDESEEDEQEESSAEVSMDDAVTVATELISQGRQKDVKDALKDLGARRVSELKGNNIAAFVKALQDD